MKPYKSFTLKVTKDNDFDENFFTVNKYEVININNTIVLHFYAPDIKFGYIIRTDLSHKNILDIYEFIDSCVKYVKENNDILSISEYTIKDYIYVSCTGITPQKYTATKYDFNNI